MTRWTRHRMRAGLAQETILRIRQILWSDGFKMNPDKQWMPETVQEIADLLIKRGLGPDEKLY